MYLLNELSCLFCQISLIVEWLSVDSVLKRYEVFVRHFRLLIVILLLLRSHKPSLLGQSLYIVFAADNSVKYFELPHFAVGWLPDYLFLYFAVYLLHFLGDGFSKGTLLLFLFLFLIGLGLLWLLLNILLGRHMSWKVPVSDYSDLLTAFFFVVLQEQTMLFDNWVAVSLVELLVTVLLVSCMSFQLVGETSGKKITLLAVLRSVLWLRKWVRGMCGGEMSVGDVMRIESCWRVEFNDIWSCFVFHGYYWLKIIYKTINDLPLSCRMARDILDDNREILPDNNDNHKCWFISADCWGMLYSKVK